MIIFFGLLISRNASNLLVDSKKSLFYKENMARFLSEATSNSSPFNISFDVALGDDVGYRYLFDYWRVARSNDFNDPLIEVVSSSERKTNFMFGGAGLSFPSGWLEDNWL